MIYKPYQPKTILNAHQHCDNEWFWAKRHDIMQIKGIDKSLANQIEKF